MSQKNVERIIGLLATDEALRRRFTEDPALALRALVDHGVELTACEFQALAALAAEDLTRFAAAIDPRLQRTDLSALASGSCLERSGSDAPGFNVSGYGGSW